MKKVLIPVMAVMVMGAGAAFGTQMAKKFAPDDGHRMGNIGEAPCVDVSQKCSETPGAACTWSENSSIQLYQIDGTVCGNELFRL